jgi:hypothetical protein
MAFRPLDEARRIRVDLWTSLVLFSSARISQVVWPLGAVKVENGHVYIKPLSTKVAMDATVD